MKNKPRFPLLAKMLLWLLLHLAVLAAAFVLFVGWQLRLGLDSLLSGAAGERLKSLGSVVAAELRDAPRAEWPAILESHTAAYGVETVLLLEREGRVLGDAVEVPRDIDEKVKRLGGRSGPPSGGPGDRRPPRPDDRFAPPVGPGGIPAPPEPRDRRDAGPDRPARSPEPRPVFLTRSQAGGYWAAIDLPLFRPGEQSPRHGILLLRSSDPSASGLFFELRPWLLGGLAVLGLSLLLWAPFIISITRYTTRLSRATESIAQGRFEVKIRGRRHDELGTLGESIERMAERLDHLLRGQKRFLGDVAHELCSPLARIRTGLGVLEHRLGPEERKRLESIDEDVGELSELISEVLAFTRAETAPESVKVEPVELAGLLTDVVARELPGRLVEFDVPEGLAVRADRRLLGRAIANVLRNADRHGGPQCRIRATASAGSRRVRLSLEDGGAGVPDAELAKLFEPFYRPDSARTREAGGVGLGLAIVRSAVEACSGSVRAARSGLGGLAVTIELPAARNVLRES